MNTRRRRVRDLAARLAALRPATAPDVALYGFMAGALHALERAEQLGYNRARAQPDLASFQSEFRRTLKAIGKGVERPRPWLAGFYFFAALMRLAALNERLDKRFDKRLDIAKGVRREVNKLKHDLSVHPARPLSVGIDNAIEVAAALCNRIERASR